MLQLLDISLIQYDSTRVFSEMLPKPEKSEMIPFKDPGDEFGDKMQLHLFSYEFTLKNFL